MLTLDLNLSEELQRRLFTKLKKDKLSSSEYFIKLLEEDLNSIIDLGEGFYFNTYLDKLFDPLDKEVSITDTQKSLLLALVDSEGSLVTPEELISKAWKSRGNVSIYTFRNMIKQIRDRTYYSLIKSHSGKGYSINIKGKE